jgi:hypothetical protein
MGVSGGANRFVIWIQLGNQYQYELSPAPGNSFVDLVLNV